METRGQTPPRIVSSAPATPPDARPLALSNPAVKRELITELQAERPDAVKLHRIVDERAAAFSAFAHRLVDAAVEVHGLLTPAQRAEVNAALSERLEKGR